MQKLRVTWRGLHAHTTDLDADTTMEETPGGLLAFKDANKVIQLAFPASHLISAERVESPR